MKPSRMTCSKLTRRAFTGGLLATAVLPAQAAPRPATRAIPSSGEPIPIVGMGSWLTFDIASWQHLWPSRVNVLRAFFEAGGGMIDSSPMYGSSEQIIGHALAQLGHPETLFSATKVWTPVGRIGVSQMKTSEKLWGLGTAKGRPFDLQQIHNLLSWETHLKTLRGWKDEGRIRYIGITTSHGRRHDELEHVMKTQRPDFVQLTYNALDREAEDRLLPLAADLGIAVIVNRPYQRKGVFHHVADTPLPAWARAEIGVTSWAQFFLSFVLSHPAVTCAIPATTRVDHMRENMAVGMGIGASPLPDAKTRTKMARFIDGL